MSFGRGGDDDGGYRSSCRSAWYQRGTSRDERWIHRPRVTWAGSPSELETMSIPVGELIEDTASLDARMHHATMHLRLGFPAA